MTALTVTAAELIERLSNLPPNLPVCVSERQHEQGGDFDLFVPVASITLATDPWSKPPREVIVLKTR